MYCLHMGIPPVENWNFYMAFSFFREATLLQGVHKHSLTGNGEVHLSWGSEAAPPAKILLWPETSEIPSVRFSSFNHLS